jgi:hypothetical protein
MSEEAYAKGVEAYDRGCGIRCIEDWSEEGGVESLTLLEPNQIRAPMAVC